MRQQLVDLSCRLCRQPGQYVLEIGVRLEPVQFGRVQQQTHHGGRALASPERARKQPVRPADGNRPDLTLHAVVVRRQVAVVDEPRQRFSVLQAVVDGLGCRRSVGHELPLLAEPLVQCLSDRARLLECMSAR